MTKYAQILKQNFPDGKIRNDLGLRSKEARALSKIRGIVQDDVSNFISEELEKGGYGGALSSSQKGAFKRAIGAEKGDPSPDSFLDLDDFEAAGRAVGIKLEISQSRVIRDKARRVGTSEAKYTGLGTSDDIDITSVQIGSADRAKIQAVQRTLKGRTGLSGADALKLINTKQFSDVKKRLLLATRNKLENLTLISDIDIDGNPGLNVLFVPNPIGNLDLNKDAILTKYFEFRFKAREGSGGNVFRVIIKAKAAFAKDMKKAGTDITSIVQKAQLDAIGGKTFGEGFVGYVAKRIVEGRRKVKPEYFNDYLSFVVAFAEQFDKKPFKVNTDVNIPTKITNEDGGTFTVRQPKKGKPKTPLQTFISSVQLTQLVQKRLGETMEKAGLATPPDFKERTGRFRRSVQIIADYRRSVMRFYYNPLYRANEQYGYQPDQQVETATREVVQTLFSQKFNIVRGR